MSALYWIIMAVANIPVYFGAAWLVFDDWEDFCDSVKFWIKPDILSWIDGEYWENARAEFKIFVWLALCALPIFAEHWALQEWVFS